MNHADLVARGVRWLKSQRCTPIMTRRSVMTDEQPDALGWQATGRSYLLECKASRADFKRDLMKGHRAVALRFPSKGMGNYRYYLTPAGLLTVSEIPEGWGLLEVHGDKVKEIKAAPHHPQKHGAEELRLLIALTRHGSGVPEDTPASQPFPVAVDALTAGGVLRDVPVMVPVGVLVALGLLLGWWLM